MKVGDKVFSTKVRPNDIATIVKCDVTLKYITDKNGTKKKETRTKYIAEYEDKSQLIFYGFNINKSIFKHLEPDGQLSFMDFAYFMNAPASDN